MKLKRFMTGALAMVLSVGMLSGCGKKVTVDEIMQKSYDESLKIAKQIDDSFADSKLTYDEYKNLMGVIPEGTYDVDMTGAGALTMSQGGISVEMSGNFNADFVIQMDASDMEMSMAGEVGFGYDALGTKGSQSVEFGVYLVKEEDGHYFYLKSGSSPAVKQYVGDIEGLFEEPLDVSEFVEQLNGETFEKQVQAQIDSNPYKDKMVLQKKTMKYDGKECYVINYDITSKMIKEILTTNEEFATALEDSGMTLDEMLDEEIAEGLTMNDIFDCMNFNCQYYYTTDDYSLVYFDIDMKDMAKGLVDVVTKALEAEEGIAITADVTDLKISYGCKQEDVDVKYDGEFVEADDDTGYDVPDIGTGEVGTFAAAAPEIKFDANAKLDTQALTAIKVGGVTGNVATLTAEALEGVGFVDYSGNSMKFENGYLYGVADGYYVYASASDGIVDDISVEADDYKPSGATLPKVDISFTEYDIKLGQSVDVLAKLGEPEQVSEYSGQFNYEWEIITDDLWYFLDVTTEDGVIVDISVYVF